MNCVPVHWVSGSADSILGSRYTLSASEPNVAYEVDRRVGDADRAHQAELGLHEQILEGVFGDRRQRRVHAEHAGTMYHRMELEVAERDALHLPVGGMVLDPVLVTPEAVARMQHRRMAVGEPREFVQPPAGELAEAGIVRFEMRADIGRQIDRQQIAQPAIGGVEIHSGAVGGDPIRRAGWGLWPAHQPICFSAQPAFQIFVMWRIFAPSNSMT